MTTQIESPSLSLGEQLRQARESLNLSLEDVSKETALRPSVLQLIESNEFVQKNIPATFMKGYVRSYARFLRLPDQLWENQFFGQIEINDLGKNARSTKAVNQYSSHNHWVGYFSALVLLIVVGMTALWWWENYRQSNLERDNLVQNYVTNSGSSDSSSTSQSQTALSTSVDIPLNSISEPMSNLNNEQVSQNSSVESASSNLSNESSIAIPRNIMMPNQTQVSSETTSISENDNPVVAVESRVVEEPVISPTPSSVQADLVIEVTSATSWISVKDKNRKVLAQKEYKKGETLTFNGDEYAVIIGAPANVKITYKGDFFPLKVDGRIAKFKLPKSE
ncbi:helix-turn-helix domain-containing protein [Rodentibacter caecimuris]|uniref:HTH cro/C1-type domain-containing protein n=1 Tax=Rodentibacter caecimuris TaxID=1796644 RepID=A0ABX3L0M4_9PAST|nr:hypothetical protein BKG89_02160 [Rodentibacter heylii]